MRTVEKFMNFHSGPILGADTSPVTHSAVSLGKDGSVRLYDYRNKKMVFKSHYPSGGSFIRYLPKSINGYGDTIIAGFEDGVLRIVSHDQISSPEVKFSLHYVFKAHKLPIRDIVFSYETDYFATTCSDKTVFFFHIKKLEGYEVTPRFNRQSVLVKPLGFVNLEQSVKSLSFIPDEEGVKSNGEIRCLVVFDEGELATLRIPTQKKIDSNISFEYQSDEVKIIGWKFSVPEVKIAAPVKKETDVKEGKAEEPAVAPVEVIKPIGPILQIQMSSLFQRVLFTEAGNFIAVVTNNVGQSEVRLCKLSTPNISRLLLVHSMPISDVKFSKSGKFLLFGGKDGMACLRKFQFDDVLIRESDQGHEIYQNESKTNESIVSEGNSVENYWNGFAHDCQRGSVTGISNSFDDSYMVTSGLDGGLVFWRNISQQISHVDGLLILILESNFQTETAPVQARQEDDEEEEDVVVSKPKIDNTVIDIVDPQYYTIQEERMKSELDREIQNAEVKKQVTRLYVQDLRTEFLKIIAENESANPDWRLPRDSLIVDSDLASDIGLFTLTIEKVTQVKIETVHKDMKWISEKERIGLEKMKAKFLDDIYIDRIEISSFRV